MFVYVLGVGRVKLWGWKEVRNVCKACMVHGAWCLKGVLSVFVWMWRGRKAWEAVFVSVNGSMDMFG